MWPVEDPGLGQASVAERFSASCLLTLLKCNCIVPISVKVDPESLKGPAFYSHGFKRTQCSTGKDYWIYVINERQVKEVKSAVYSV